MKRRGLLVAGGATGALAVAALGWPGWLRRAFVRGVSTRMDEKIEPDPATGSTAQPGAMRRSPATTLAEAEQQAIAEGKKLLVFVVPADAWQRYQRGHAIGEFLNHGSSADLAPLASALVVCATVADVQSKLGGLVLGEPLLLTVGRVGVRSFDAPLPQLSQGGRGRDNPDDDKLIAERIALLAGLVKKALDVPPGDVEAIAQKVREQIVKKPPQGGQWASSSGCGVDYEEGPEKSEMVDCGMGYVPAKSARFLHFLAAKAKP